MQLQWQVASAVGVLILCVPALGQDARETQVTVLWQGIEEFDTARAANALEASVRRPVKAGGVERDSIFLHPTGRELTTLEFPPTKIRPEGPVHVFFVAHVGIADGFDWNDAQHPADGARFYVSVSGQRVAEAHLRQSGWRPLAADLGPVGAGEEREFAIQLATDSGPEGNSNYDWAHFGEPLLVAASQQPLSPGTAYPGTTGMLLARFGQGGAEVVVEPLDADRRAIRDGPVRATAADPGTVPVAFDFGSLEDCVAWRCRVRGGQAEAIRGGAFAPQLEVTSVGPARAVCLAGEPILLRAAAKNRGLGTALPTQTAIVRCAGASAQLGRLRPGEEQILEFELPGRPAGEFSVPYAAELGDGVTTGTAGPFYVWPGLPELDEERPAGVRAEALDDGYVILANDRVRWLVQTRAPGLGALLWVWGTGEWTLVGTASPLAELVVPGTEGASVDFRQIRVRAGRQALLTARGAWQSPTGQRAEMTLRLRLPAGSEAMDIRLEAHAEQPLTLGALRGPAVHAGDRAGGATKGIAVFPGLEFLHGEERSSSARDLAPPLNVRTVPHRFKVTVPMMMVQTEKGGPVVAVIWDPGQPWDGEHSAPAACFASPNFVEQQDNHLMQLFLPSVPDYVAENTRLASAAQGAPEAYVMQPGRPLTLRQYVAAGFPETDASGAFAWFDRLVGFARPEAWPRTFDEEMALCRHRFLETVWDEASERSRHVVGGGTANSPGFATLMLMDARAVAGEQDRQGLVERVNLIERKTLQEGGAEGLAGRALCHIMAWEFPYHRGHLPEALGGMRAQAYASLERQEEDGGWGFYPDERRSVLGERGTRTVGICARETYSLAKWAAISGDPAVLTAMDRGLRFMRCFHVPRGAQGWECPVMEPDVLAAAYGVRAYVWAYLATSDDQWLDHARYWARTGLAFQYAWDDGQHPGMRYASIPVFGSTFFTHSWIGLPVQWCGLVYAYSLQELLRFDDNDLWRREAEGITVSAMCQQWPMDNEELAGSYPDSWGNWFTQRRGVHINPEDIAVNALALRGLDPGLRSVQVQTEGGPVHVTAPADLKAQAAGEELQVELKYLPGQTLYATIAPVAAGEVTRVVADGESLPPRESLGAGDIGWACDEEIRVMAVGVKADGQGQARLTVSGIEFSPVPGPQ